MLGSKKSVGAVRPAGNLRRRSAVSVGGERLERVEKFADVAPKTPDLQGETKVDTIRRLE